tara:strand:+ start:208 stop:510 length:303 start_codon:yes stop_codon:yes gene_type:complete
MEGERLEKFVSVAELFEYMREKDLVITNREKAEQRNLRDELLQKKSLTIREIIKGNFWGISSKTGVIKRLEKLKDGEHYKDGNKIKVLTSAVKREARLTV